MLNQMELSGLVVGAPTEGIDQGGAVYIYNTTNLGDSSIEEVTKIGGTSVISESFGVFSCVDFLSRIVCWVGGWLL